LIIPGTYDTLPGVHEAGGKGMNLLLLKQQGYPVPAFVILPVSFFVDTTTADDVVKKTQGIESELLRYFGNSTTLAVRSSAVAEDSSHHSFAGQFKTVLNVTAENLAGAVADVWQSADNISTAYKQHAGVEKPGMAVIIQEMADAGAAGVAFGINPLTGENEIVVNAVNGLGEELVSGRKNSDEYIIKGGTISVRHQRESAPVLSILQLQQVAETMESLAALYGHPQDIEFAFAGERFFLLQSRPVTTIGKSGERIIWDNSNIIESYPGLTLPLTFTFIEKMYAAVYKQLSLVLGVSSAKVNTHESVYDNMLGLLNGRVYYNLNSWYAALSLLPGYKLNAEFMERMMGVKEKADVVVPTDGKEKGIKDYLDIVGAAKSILGNLLTVRKQKTDFIRDFDAVHRQYAGKDYSSYTLSGIFSDYRSFEQMMVSNWKAPLINDFFAMIYFGLLQKLCTLYFAGHTDIHNRLLASSRDIITTEPVRRIPLLLAALQQQPEFRNVLQTGTPGEVWALLNSGKYKQELELVWAYLADWGERCAGELKLETVTYNQQPELLMAVLQAYTGRPTGDTTVSTGDARGEAEKTAHEVLQGKFLKRKIFRHVLANARYLVSNRENLRYYRTKGFGVVRHMMCAMGKKMQDSGLIADTRDVFFLRLDEVEQIAGSQYNGDIKAVVAKRKEDYTLFGELPLPERLETLGKQKKVLLPAMTTTDKGPVSELRGIACSPGIVRGKVCKINTIGDAFPNNEILVTYATDPGYVVMFPSSKGILTERGSLLSHAAIVSREMNIPCIVGITGLMEQLNHGDEIIMDGSTGIVKILNRATGI